jgi:hydroxyacylglutathione hydrolase
MVGGQLPDHWWAATRKCIGRPDWQLHWQTHRYNPDLYILRQTACSHAEKPFLYLLFGKDRALLLDTGAEGGERALVRAVRAVLGTWLAHNHHASILLVVGHLHSHGDHIAGDEALSRLPNTTVIPHSSVRGAPGDLRHPQLVNRPRPLRLGRPGAGRRRHPRP